MSIAARGVLSENVICDDEKDILTIYGTRISGELLRGFAEVTPPGRAFRIIKHEDGHATIQMLTLPNPLAVG